MERHAVEAFDSWETYKGRNSASRENVASESGRRRLKHHKDKDEIDLVQMEHDKEVAYLTNEKKANEATRFKAKKKHDKLLNKLYADPGIKQSTVHGFMIDAGSTGSRLHIYEWEPRVLSSHSEVQDAVSGKKLSFPESASRWTDRLRPGVATFSSLPDDELVENVASYFSPLIEFAKTVLREKEESFENFPIFFRATAGMRTLEKNDRSRVLGAIRELFSDKTFCPFYFEDEYARILSGEEEAIFGWTGINFIMGNLVEDSQGAGTVINPKLTYGSLDMGGASTQISFYEPQEDIMANLFKLQIGQGKHWNLYSHSFLYYGINAARDRFEARLLAGQDAQSRLIDGVYNPCLPGGSRREVRLNIHVNSEGDETWEDGIGVSSDGFYQAMLKNDGNTGDFEGCMSYAKQALHLEKNSWCDFAHKGDCAFNGVSMPELPTQGKHFGEFLAFSNYFHVWEFLGLPQRASVQELYNATQMICSMSQEELFDFNKKHAKVAEGEAIDFCFRSSYVFNILRNGYKFKNDDYITATDVLNGHKVGWALGAMLYEINTFPWEYVDTRHKSMELTDSDAYSDSYTRYSHRTPHLTFIVFMLLSIIISLASMFTVRRKRREYYEPLKNSEVTPLNV